MLSKYRKYEKILLSECSVEACNIIIHDLNTDFATLGLDTLPIQTEVGTANAIATEGVKSALKAAGKQTLNGLSAAVSYLGNGFKRMTLTTKRVERSVGRINAKAHGVEGDRKTRFVDSQHVKSFHPKGSVGDFADIQKTLSEFVGVASKAPEIANRLSSTLHKLKKCNSLEQIDSTMASLIEVVTSVVKSGSPNPKLLGMLNKHRYKGGYSQYTRSFSMYGRSIGILIAKSYGENTRKPLALYSSVSTKSKGKSIAVPSTTNLPKIVTFGNKTLGIVFKAAKVNTHYNKFAKDMRDVRSSIPSDEENEDVAKHAHNAVDGIYNIYRVFCYSIVMDAISATEKYSLLLEDVLKEYD